MKTFNQIVNELDKAGITASNSYGFEDIDSDNKEAWEALGETETVFSKGGGEGEGEYVERVIHFKDHDVYIKITGSYYSYDGTTWDEGMTEVRPQEKTITVYE